MNQFRCVCLIAGLISGCSSSSSGVSAGTGGSSGALQSSGTGGNSVEGTGGSGVSVTGGATARVTGGDASGGNSSFGLVSAGSKSVAGGAGTTGGTATAGAGANTYSLICTDPITLNGIDGSSLLTDSRDGQMYPIITIGTQTWMARNLNVGQMVPGIPEFPGESDDTKIERFCYGDLPENCTRCGGLYTWSEALALPNTCDTQDCSSQIQTVHRGICPIGWHIPKQSEWTTLAAALANQTGYLTIDPVQYECRPDLGTAMKSSSGWGENGDGTNTTGWNAMPAGWRHSWGRFYNGGRDTYFQAAEMEPVTMQAWGRSLTSSNTNFCMTYFYRDHAVSVRCVKD
ncbi:MAG TPA: FISUMP domain-containing protein [Polyangiaceae bacterium]